MKQSKTVADSLTVLSGVMMPVHANHHGNVHGGTILKLVDEAAFVCATKHARENVVMASMDHIVFNHAVRIGDILTIRAHLCHVGRSSMDVKVEIETEKLKAGKTIHVGSAYLTMVALNQKGSPTKVPQLSLTTKEDHLKSKHALTRRKKRLGR